MEMGEGDGEPFKGDGKTLKADGEALRGNWESFGKVVKGDVDA